MKFKDIDIKALTKKSVEQVYESRMPKQIIKEEDQEDKGRLPGSKRTLFDLFPFFQTSKKTFSVQNSTYPNEQLFRQIFANIANQDIVTAIKNLNNALGIVVREDGSHDFIEDTNRGNISNTFSALSIISNMYFASKANESMTGHLFEPLIAGMVSGNTVGYKNDIEDIILDPRFTNMIDGNKVTPQQFSLKVVGKKFDLSLPGILKRINDPKFINDKFIFNVIAIFKKEIEINQSKGSVYNFYKFTIDQNNIFSTLYSSPELYSRDVPPTGQRRENWIRSAVLRRQQDMRNIYETLEAFIKPMLQLQTSDKIPSPTKKRAKDIWEAFKEKWCEQKVLASPKSAKNYPTAAQGIMGWDIKNLSTLKDRPDINKIYQDFDKTFYEDPVIGSEYLKTKESVKGFASDGDTEETPSENNTPTETPSGDEKKWPLDESAVRPEISAGGNLWNQIGPKYLGSILLAREVYENRLKQEEGGLVNKFTELLLPLQNALDNTNEYFLQKDAGAKVQNLQKAQQETEKFKQAAENILNPKQQAQGSLEESLDLTDEAKMVIELLESYNRRNDG